MEPWYKLLAEVGLHLLRFGDPIPEPKGRRLQHA
jgi:hypothetical protein